MTIIDFEKETCYFCGEEYETRIIRMWHTEDGEPPKFDSTCPRCGAPKKEFHAPGDTIIEIYLSNFDRNGAEAASQSLINDLVIFCRSEAEIEVWHRALLDLGAMEAETRGMISALEASAKDPSLTENYRQILALIQKYLEPEKKNLYTKFIDENVRQAKIALQQEIANFQKNIH